MAQKGISNLVVMLIRTPARSTYVNHMNQKSTSQSNPPKNFDLLTSCMETNCCSGYFGKRNYGTMSDPKLNILRKWFPQTTEIDDQAKAKHEHQEEDHSKEDGEGWSHMKFGFAMLGACIFSLGMWTSRESAKPVVDAEEKCAEHDFNEYPGVHQHYYQRMMQQLMKPLNSPCLQTQRPYILVLDMKELLLYLDWNYHKGQHFEKSPGVHKVFTECVKHMNEIVVFAAEMGLTVIPVLDVTELNDSFLYRSVRDATYFTDGHHMKNLHNLKRFLKKIIVIDKDIDSEKSHIAKTFNFGRWLTKDNEEQTEHVKSFFEKFAGVKVNNGYGVSQYYRQMDYPIMHSEGKQKQRSEQPKDTESEDIEKDVLLKKLASSILDFPED